MNKSFQPVLYIVSVALVFAVALGLRSHAAHFLSIDYDEDD